MPKPLFFHNAPGRYRVGVGVDLKRRVEQQGGTVAAFGGAHRVGVLNLSPHGVSRSRKARPSWRFAALECPKRSVFSFDSTNSTS